MIGSDLPAVYYLGIRDAASCSASQQDYEEAVLENVAYDYSREVEAESGESMSV